MGMPVDELPVCLAAVVPPGGVGVGGQPGGQFQLEESQAWKANEVRCPTAVNEYHLNFYVTEFLER